MAKFDKGALFEEIRQGELKKLRKAIKESLQQKKLKELERLVQWYLLIIKPQAQSKGALPNSVILQRQGKRRVSFLTMENVPRLGLAANDGDSKERDL